MCGANLITLHGIHLCRNLVVIEFVECADDRLELLIEPFDGFGFEVGLVESEVVEVGGVWAFIETK